MAPRATPQNLDWFQRTQSRNCAGLPASANPTATRKTSGAMAPTSGPA